MKRNLLVLLAAVVALAFAAHTANAGCDFEHPRKAKIFKCDLVQAFISCGNPMGANSVNTTTASGVSACEPPQTPNQQAGTPINGWQWWEQRSTGKLSFRGIQGSGGNTGDMKVKLRLRKILDGAGGLASGSGTLSTLARTTLEDTVISSPGMGTDMTVIDFPAPFAFTMSNGNATLNTTVNTLLQGLGIAALPGCTSIEVIDLTILDPNGNPFAKCGQFFKDLPN